MEGRMKKGRVEFNYLWKADASICILGQYPYPINSDVRVCARIWCHLHVCSNYVSCVSMKHVTAWDPGPWKNLLTERWYLGVGDGLSCTERRRVAGRRETGGKEAGLGWSTVCVCVLCRRMCMYGSKKIVLGRGCHGEPLWIAKPVISPRLWKSDKTLSVSLPFLSSFVQPLCYSFQALLPFLSSGSHLNFRCHFSFFAIKLPPQLNLLSFLFVSRQPVVPCSLPTNHTHWLQHTHTEMIAFQTNKGNGTRLVLFSIPFPLLAWGGDGQHLRGSL